MIFRSYQRGRFTLQGTLLLAGWLGAFAGTRPACAAEGMRNPFWPVGYWPEAFSPVEAITPEIEKNMDAAAAARTESAWQEARRRLVLRGISQQSDGRSVVLVNGRTYAAGEIVKVFLGDKTYRWKIVQIDLSGVSVERYIESAVDSRREQDNSEKISPNPLMSTPAAEDSVGKEEGIKL